MHRIENEKIRGSEKVTCVSKKIQERRLLRISILYEGLKHTQEGGSCGMRGPNCGWHKKQKETEKKTD